MIEQYFENASDDALQEFKKIANTLLDQTFLVQRLYDPKTESRYNNKEYLFLIHHREWFENYFAFIDWNLEVDEYNGIAYIHNETFGKRFSFTKLETIVLLGIRLLYEDALDNLGMDNDALYTVKDLLDVIVTDYPLIKGKPNMKEISRSLSLLEHYQIIQPISGKMNRLDGQFSIMPTVTYVVNRALLDRVINEYMEDKDEETGENPAD